MPSCFIHEMLNNSTFLQRWKSSILLCIKAIITVTLTNQNQELIKEKYIILGWEETLSGGYQVSVVMLNRTNLFSVRSSGNECEYITGKGQNDFQEFGNGDYLLVTDYTWTLSIFLSYVSYFHSLHCMLLYLHTLAFQAPNHSQLSEKKFSWHHFAISVLSLN